MKLLVTGAAGFIGLNVVEQALRRCDQVISLGLQSPAQSPPAQAAIAGATFVTCDVRDARALAALFDAHRPVGVVHAAALTPGPRADPRRATEVIDVNLAGTVAVLRAARAAGVARVVLTSSSAVYGDAPFGDAPVTEDTVPTPSTLYGFTKLAAERLAVQSRELDGLDVVRARLTAIYGPWEHDTGVRDTLSPPLQIARAALAANGRWAARSAAGSAAGSAGPPTVIADGGARDWTPAAEVARALIALLARPVLKHDVYNLGIGETWHPERLCRALAERLDGFGWTRSSSVAPTIAYNDALDRPRRSPPSPARFLDEFGAGVDPRSGPALGPALGQVFGPVQAGIDAYADWVVTNRAALEPAMRPSTTADSKPLPDR